MNDFNIKEIRNKLGLTQTELANKIGVDLKTVQNWEKGKTIPKTKHGIIQSLLEIGNISHIEEHRFFGGENQSNVNGDNIKGGTVTVNKSDTDKLIEALQSSQSALAVQQRINEKSQEQIDRLLGILERMTSGVK